ncbi:hypothetical protein PMZ80_005172 [Knufia obscura]|uniref:Programmed cell death protein 2 C-terminal domain-containing protein n=2 Tax=Knufia TaxID=430999 RepID=A0AAN8EWP5_9EURO|nr:hypothetical protein PMZ80_005172 [Knufia obscura]KAK5957840.1 hypothetical protein OHC33_001029 [Knufia fluminis]
MAPYDSDTSSEDGLDVQTNVTLGYATQEPTGDDISHVGGHPTWLDDNTKPTAALAKCKVCNGYMSLLLQLQADLQQHFPDDERRLFVWCCRKKQCSKKPGSVRAFREVRKAKTSRKPEPSNQETGTSETKPQQDLGSQLFGGSPPPSSTNSNPFSTASSQAQNNPFSTSSQPNGTTNPFSELAAKPPQPPTQSFADKLRISSPTPEDRAQNKTQKQEEQEPQDPWPSPSLFPTPLPTYNIDAESEYLDPTPATSTNDAGPSNSRITELADDPAGSSSAEKDLYESPHDKTFTTFTSTLSQNPEQILRYEFSGQPLLYSSTDLIAPHFVLPGHHLHQKIKTSGPVKGIPRCQHCGAGRVFEMQLTPYLIYELEKDNEAAMSLEGGEGMEWGTILVGCCSRNCGEEGKVVFREEWVGVQWEEGGVELKQKK